MRRLASIALLAFLATSPAAAAVDPAGTSSDAPHFDAAPTTATIPARVLWYVLGGPNDETARFAGYGLQITIATSPAQMAAANYSNYDILIISSVCPGQLTAERQRIINFVNAGGGLLVHQPGCSSGDLGFMPPGFEIVMRSSAWCDFPNSFYPAQLVGTPHPIVAGLTSNQLSGAFDWVDALGPGFTVLAINAQPGCSDPALAAGTYGNGRVAFEDGQASTVNGIHPGADAYWINLLTWLYAGSIVPARHSSWGELKTLYR